MNVDEQPYFCFPVPQRNKEHSFSCVVWSCVVHYLWTHLCNCIKYVTSNVMNKFLMYSKEEAVSVS